MPDFEGVANELAWQTAKVRAEVGAVPPPAQLIADLHNIPFVAGDQVVDSVTGLEGVILGGGIENVPSEGA